jgi:hypothetical protein
MTDVNLHIEPAVADQVDRWRRAHPLQPSRRAAVRALLKLALRQVQKKEFAKATTPAPTVPAPAGEQVSA